MEKVILQFYNDSRTAVDRARTQQYYDFVKSVNEDIQPIVDNLQELIDVAAYAPELSSLNPELDKLVALHEKLFELTVLADNVGLFDGISNENLTDIVGFKSSIIDVGSEVSAISTLNAKLTELVALHEQLTKLLETHGKLTEIEGVHTELAKLIAIHEELAKIVITADNIQAIIDAPTWAEGTDVEVAALGGTKSAKGWAESLEDNKREVVSLGTGSDREPVGGEITLTTADYNKVITLRPQSEDFTVIIPDASIDHEGKPLSIEYGNDNLGYVIVKTATGQKIGRHDDLFFSRNAESVKLVANSDKYIVEGDAGLFNPAVVVNSEYQMDAAVEKLKRLIGGGNITIATGFTLTEDKDWNLGKITLFGDGGANTAITTDGYRITVRGGLYAQAVRFVGPNSAGTDGSTFMRLLADTDDPVCQATFNMCMFRDIVGTIDTTPHIEVQTEGSGNGWNIRIQSCDTVTPGITGVTGLIFELGALSFLNIYVNLQARADGYEKVVVRGTEPSGGASLFSTDGSATMVSTFMNYTEILPFIKTADTDIASSYTAIIDPAGSAFDIDFTGLDNANPVCFCVYVGFSPFGTSNDRYFSRIYSINSSLGADTSKQAKIIVNGDGGGSGQTTAIGTLSLTAITDGFNLTKTSGSASGKGRLVVRVLSAYNTVQKV